MSNKQNMLNIIKIQNFIRDKKKQIFTPIDIERYFGVTNGAAIKFILRNVKKGVYAKIKRGLYFDKNLKPSELEIANKMYSPSYISFEYALSYYGIIPETVYSVTSATSKTSREFNVLNIAYNFYHLKRELFFGYETKNINGQLIYIAEPEKAFIDYLYFIDLRKKALSDRIDIKKLNYDKILKFSKIFKRASLNNLIEKIYDQSRRNKEIVY